MKKLLRSCALILIPAAALILSPVAYSAVIVPITSFDPTTYFSGGVTAGFDFDVDYDTGTPGGQYYTQSGFLSVPATSSKTYTATHNGITLAITYVNANQSMQNRYRNAPKCGYLVTDFAQWYNKSTTSGAVEVRAGLSGLVANTDYEVGFFTFNQGAGQTTHNFYEGASSAAPLITTFTTAGSENNYSTWSPGIKFRINSGAGGQISVTMQGIETFDGTNYSSRATLNGISVNIIPEPASLGMLGVAGLALIVRRRPRG